VVIKRIVSITVVSLLRVTIPLFELGIDIFSHTSVQFDSSTVNVGGCSLIGATGLLLWQPNPVRIKAIQHPRNIRDFIVLAFFSMKTPLHRGFAV
jgi:hypothetical protein